MLVFLALLLSVLVLFQETLETNKVIKYSSYIYYALILLISALSNSTQNILQISSCQSSLYNPREAKTRPASVKRDASPV